MTGSQEQTRPPEGVPLDAYIDGQLHGEDFLAFEARLAGLPALREEIELQRRIDGSLGRLFGAPPEREVAADAARGPWRVHPALLGLAAAVALVTAAVWIFVGVAMQETRNRLGPAYHETVAAGFVPAEVCTTPEEFANWLRDNYGQALYPADDPGIEYIGWSYANIVTGYTGLLLAHVDGERVIVAVDRREHDHARQARPDDPTLSIHRRRIGDLVLYEVTPLGRARILPVLSRSGP